MRIGSLCSGYGGLDMAAEALTGGRTVWVSDVDKGANKILAHRYPDVPNLGDFTVMDWSTVEPIDMLTAGYPCQPFSHAGKRAGTNDARHLWPEVLRCLTELRPRFALFENVRGHLSLGFDQVLADLATHDYDARWIVLRAADIGAPHGRARLFILASDARRSGDRWDLVGAGRGSVRVGGVRGEDPDRGADAGGADLLSLTQLRKSLGWPTRLLPTPTTSDTNGAGEHGVGGADLRTTVSLLPTPTTTQRGTDANLDTREGARANLHNAVLLPTPSAADGLGGHERRGGARGDELLLNGVAKEMAARLLPTPLVGSSSPAAHGQISGQFRDQMAEALANWGDYAPAIHRWEQILGRPAPAPTMTSAKGNPQLSPRFVEWMMGLPEGWVDDVPNLTRNEKLKALGNGVVSQQAVEAVLRLLALTERGAA